MEEEVWGYFAGETVRDLFRIQGTLNQHGYHSILQRYTIPSGLRLVGQSFVFKQGNDPTHLQAVCKGYLTNKESDGVLVWAELDRRVKEKQPTSAQYM
jgi:hypothetical protein